MTFDNFEALLALSIIWHAILRLSGPSRDDKKSSSKSSRTANGSGGSNNKRKTASNNEVPRKRSSQRTAAASPKCKRKLNKTQVEFSSSAKKQLADLELTRKQRKEVEQWHTRIVRREMKRLGADHASIVYLAHSEGSNDKKPHITASLRNKELGILKNRHGKLTHLYYDSDRMPSVYRRR